MKNIAVMHYHSSHGVDTLLFLTDLDVGWENSLPEIDKRLLEAAGVLSPLEDDDESAEWVHILPIDGLPKIIAPVNK